MKISHTYVLMLIHSMQKEQKEVPTWSSGNDCLLIAVSTGKLCCFLNGTY